VTAKGYTTVTLVAQELAVDLTAPQLDQLAGIIERAEAWIDRQTGRAWIQPTPIADEIYNVEAGILYLRTTPVSAVTSLSVRSMVVGSSYQVLVPGTDYELLDPLAGVVSLASGWPQLLTYWGRTYDRFLAKVSYTVSTPAPSDIQQAATLLAAYWMQYRLQPESRGISSYRVASNGDEFSTTYQGGSGGSASDVPPDVLAIVRAREAVIFA